MTKIHMVLCTAGDYPETQDTLPVRACRTVERASQLIGELNGIYEREVDSISYPRAATEEEEYSYEVEEAKEANYNREVAKALERVCELYREKYGLIIPDMHGDTHIYFWMMASELED